MAFKSLPFFDLTDLFLMVTVSVNMKNNRHSF